MLVAIAPIVPVLGVVAAASLVGGLWWYSQRDEGDLGPLGPGNVPQPLPPPQPNPNGPVVPGRGGEETDPASAIVDGLIGTYEDAAFHETQSGDSINRVVTKVLNGISPGAGNKPAMIGGLRRLLNRSKWNRDLYGEPMDDNYAFEGVAVNRVYMPKHEDASAVMRSGFFPRRNTNAQGQREGSARSWGDLWVPALNDDAIRNGVSDPDIMLAPPWPDGTPATEPPPELYEALRLRGQS